MRKISLLIIGCIILLWTGCNAMPVQTPGVSSTSVLTPTKDPTLTSTPTLIPTSAVLPTPTSTLIPTSTPMPTPTNTPTPLPDTETPVLQLLGGENIEIIARSEFVEPGVFAEDDRDGDLTERVQVTGQVDVNWCGDYTLIYEVADTAGNSAKVERLVTVKQPEVITPEGKVIYLTFDDGPGKYTEELLMVLEKYNIKATFFTCGNGKPELVKKIYEASSFNPEIMTRLTYELEMRGFQYFDWNVSSGDSGTKSTEKILENLKKGIKGRKCSVVLQHPETRGFSMDAVEDLIIWALDNGYSFLPLDETSPRAHHTVKN